MSDVKKWINACLVEMCCMFVGGEQDIVCMTMKKGKRIKTTMKIPNLG